jgi:phosphatidylglycerophosphate synthase
VLTPISISRVERSLPYGPGVGLLAQVMLLAGLAATVGLDPAGMLAGLVYGGLVCAVLMRGVRLAGASELGPADWVTLARATLVGGVAALAADSFTRPVPVGVLFALAVLALVLDGVDGQVARRTGTASALGARFDVEIDAFLVLALSVYATHPMGAWVLVIGLARYGFLAAAWVLPWLRRPLPPRFWRKVVAATQGVALAVAAARLLPDPLLVAGLAAVLVLLVESFGRDVRWLWHQREVPAIHHAGGSPA